MGRLFPFFNFGLPFNLSSFLMRNKRFRSIGMAVGFSSLCSFLVFVHGTTRCPSLAFLLGFRTGPVKTEVAVLCISGRLEL